MIFDNHKTVKGDQVAPAYIQFLHDNFSRKSRGLIIPAKWNINLVNPALFEFIHVLVLTTVTVHVQHRGKYKNKTTRHRFWVYLVYVSETVQARAKPSVFRWKSQTSPKLLAPLHLLLPNNSRDFNCTLRFHFFLFSLLSSQVWFD